MNKLIVLTIPLFLLAGCNKKTNNKSESSNESSSSIVSSSSELIKDKKSYGVFLSVDEYTPFAKERFKQYEEVVIDAQYFSIDEISDIKSHNTTVYSYMNVGAIENFRSYYDTYKQYAIGEYEHWDEELWMDVTRPEWQNFLVDELADQFFTKGVDGLFIDNLDVYYEYPSEDIFTSITEILKALKEYDFPIIINGGDTFVSEYLSRCHLLDDVMDAVNQETVFSMIDWDHETFSKNDDEEKEYFQEYLDEVSPFLNEVYLLEYTADDELIKEIKDYCDKHHFKYYISSSLELTL